MKNNHQSYDVVLLLHSEVNKKAMLLSQSVAENFPVEFVLDNKAKYPHVSLYHLEIPDANLKEAKNRLGAIFQNHSKISLKLLDFSNQGSALVWNCEKTDEVYDLHKKVVKILNELREGLIVFESIPHLPSQGAVVKRYGWKSIFQFFDPHITISKLKREKDTRDALKFLGDTVSFSTVFQEAALGTLSDHGTVTDIIKRYPLH